jgi:hypothetical protein
MIRIPTIIVLVLGTFTLGSLGYDVALDSGCEATSRPGYLILLSLIDSICLNAGEVWAAVVLLGLSLAFGIGTCIFLWLVWQKRESLESLYESSDSQDTKREVT